MMTAPINQMIDALDFKCLRCGASRKVGCDCWVPIMLRCPQCGRTQKTTKEDGDPPGTAVVETSCSKCFDDKTATITWWDAHGNELFASKRSVDR